MGPGNSKIKKQNLTPENLDVGREQIQAFIDEGRPEGGDPVKTPDDLHEFLKEANFTDVEVEKTLSDWDSYL